MEQKGEKWRSACRCGGGEAQLERRFDERMDEMYSRYRCPACGVYTLAHLTRWEAQAEWEEKYAAGH